MDDFLRDNLVTCDNPAAHELGRTYTSVDTMSGDNRKQWDKYLEHQLVWKNQREQFQVIHQGMLHGPNHTDLLVVLDFTQLQLDSTLTQDLILMLHDWDNTERKVRRRYFHFLGCTDGRNHVKNDQYFVAGVLEFLFADGCFTNAGNVHFWSDGGSKHFKQRFTMGYLAELCRHYHRAITWNFFGSNHGHNPCDAVAAHANKQIQWAAANNNRKAVRTAQEACEAIQRGVGVTTQVETIPNAKVFCRYHHFFFDAMGLTTAAQLTGSKGGTLSKVTHKWFE